MVRKSLIFVMVLMVSTISFGQFDGFHEFKKNNFYKSVSTQEEAFMIYRKVMDEYGADTTYTDYRLQSNPLIFGALKLPKKKVLVGVVLKEKNLKYGIIFIYMKDKYRFLFEVEDVDGEMNLLVYDPYQ